MDAGNHGKVLTFIYYKNLMRDIVMNSKSRREFFDKEAPFWEEKHYPEEVRQKLVELIPIFDVKEGINILDVGTGSGILIPYLRRLLGSSGKICAFDLSLPMILEARRKITSTEDLVVCADVHHIPFPSGYFDRVICFAAFPHFDFPRQALGEMVRVLKRDGRLVIAHLLSRDELIKHHAARDEVAQDILPDDEAFKVLFEEANLELKEIIDRAGRFVVWGTSKT